jgi:hypothetical protein
VPNCPKPACVAPDEGCPRSVSSSVPRSSVPRLADDIHVRMGNGASAVGGGSCTALAIPGDSSPLGEDDDSRVLKSELTQTDDLACKLDCKARLRLSEVIGELDQYKVNVLELRHLITEKDAEVNKLKAEIHKLKSVLAMTVQKGKQDILSTIHEEAAKAGQEQARTKKQGVSGESSGNVPRHKIERFEKEFRYAEVSLIHQCPGR